MVEKIEMQKILAPISSSSRAKKLSRDNDRNPRKHFDEELSDEKNEHSKSNKRGRALADSERVDGREDTRDLMAKKARKSDVSDLKDSAKDDADAKQIDIFA